LVHRIVSPPDIVKLKTAEYACIKLKQLGYALTPKKFNEIRNNEEKKIRHSNFEQNEKDFEADIATIISDTLIRITSNKHSNLTQDIITYEIKNEIKHLYLNTDAKTILDKLKNKGKTIIICSDMYLAEAHIKQIAENFGITRYIDKFYVSATDKITKGSGQLFKFILQNLNCEAKAILHIGDNPISDYITPTKLNIKSLYYYNKEQLKKYKKKERLLYLLNHTKKKINHKLLKNFMSINNCKSDFMEISHAIAPALSVFAYHALLDMYKIGVSKVFFFAREGILLQKIFSVILNTVLHFQSERKKFKLEVIYISRLSSVCAVYYNKKNTELLIENCRYANGCLSVLNFINTFGLSLTDFSTQTLEIINPYLNHINRETLIYLFESTTFGSELDKLLKEKIKLLKNYLSAQGVFSQGKIGLVDLGWGGTIQKNISHFLSDYPTTEFFGYYFGTNSLISDKNSHIFNRSTIYPGYILFHKNHYNTAKLIGAAPLLESLCGDDQLGTTLAYTFNDHNHITPLLKQHLKKNSNTILFQTTIKNHLLHDIQNFGELFNIAGLPFEKLKTYATKKLLKFIFKPKKIDIKRFQTYSFNYNWSTNLEHSLINTIKISDILKPKELLKKIHKSPWRYGTIASARIPFLFFFYNLIQLIQFCLNYLPTIKKSIYKLLHLKKF
ncbi:MAG: HAD hydrolase-like protein, partial [Rickettsiella sp.]|nr:HAD hydrolase-like protein [Rickettsiella sp.]